MSRVKNIFKGNAGFTLIELLIVIVIIGILAAIAIPNIVGLTDTADRGSAESDLRTLLTEVSAERAKDGDYSNATGVALWTELEGKYENASGSASSGGFTFRIEIDDEQATVTEEGVKTSGGSITWEQ